MGNFSKRQVVKDLLEGKKSEHLLVIPNILSLSAARYGYGMPDIFTDPVKYTESVIGYKHKIGFDGYCGGLLVLGITDIIAGHLPNSEGVISGNGEDTIHTAEDIEKLKPFDVNNLWILENIAKNIEILREKDPDEPVYVIFNNPAQMALQLMGDAYGYKKLIRDPGLFIKVMEAISEPILDAAKAIWDMGVDYLWEPLPSFGGFCISRDIYGKHISPTNAKFNKKLADYGAKIVIHTCGKFNDRYDYVAGEYGSGWHISNVDTKKIVEEYSDQVAIIGNLPCIDVILNGTPEEVYKAAYKDSMDGGPSGRFILSSDCDISPQSSDENILAIVKAGRDADKALWG